MQCEAKRMTIKALQDQSREDKAKYTRLKSICLGGEAVLGSNMVIRCHRAGQLRNWGWAVSGPWTNHSDVAMVPPEWQQEGRETFCVTFWLKGTSHVFNVWETYNALKQTQV